MIQLVVEMPEAQTLKDKRQQVSSVKSRVIRKFRISFAEVDLLDSVAFAHFGGAVVSNSREHGEAVMQKVLDFVEKCMAARIHDYQIHTESF